VKVIKAVTRLGKEIEHRLADFNDEMSFFLFLDHEFSKRLSDFGTAVGKLFTTDVFVRNPYAPTIHVKVDELPTFIGRNRSATFSVYLTASYEVASSFLDTALEFLQVTNAGTLVMPNRIREGPEQYYARALTASGLPSPGDDLIRTMSWIRHRRNSLVHVAGIATHAYSDLVRDHGQALNAFWATAKLSLDFSNPALGPLDEEQAIELLKILRISIQKLDLHFVSLIHSDGLAKAEAKRLFSRESIRMNKLVAHERSEKLRRELWRGYHIRANDAELIEAAQAYGIKG
jgi:hypothetical protein